MFFPFISEMGTKAQCRVRSCQLSGTDRACKARAGHPLTIRAAPCYSSLIPQPLAPHPLPIRLTSALPRPSCSAFASSHMPSRDVWHQLQNYHQLYLVGESKEHENKTGCSERDGDVSSSQVFCWKKQQPNTEVSFLPHSLTQKKASRLSAFTCQGD